jgi:hypothetical protein
MMWQLLRRDPSWRWTPWLTLGSAAFCVLWQWKAPHEMGIHDGIASMIFIGAFSLLAWAASHAVGAQQDDTRFQSLLPVTVRQIYLSRTLSVVAMLWIPVTAVAIMVIAANSMEPPPLLMLVNFVSVFTLTAVAIQAAIVRGVIIPVELIRGSFTLWAAGAGLVPLLIIARPDPAFSAWMFVPAICWLSTAVIFATTFRTAPMSFQSAPIQPSTKVARREPSRNATASTTPWLSLWISMFRGGLFWIFYAFLASAFFGTEMFSVIIAAGMWPTVRTRARWLLALPVSPAAFLPVILLPYFLALGGGYLISVHVASFHNTEERRLTVRASQEGFLGSWPDETPNCKTLNILPAPEFWIPVKAGQTPPIQAPLGETFRPPTTRRFGFSIYNPYAVGCANSSRFFDWQFSRATLGVYGRSIARQEFAVGDVVDKHLVLTSVRNQTIGVAEIAGILILGVLIPLIGDWHRFRRLAQPVRVAIYVLAGALGVGIFMATVPGRLDILQWLAWALPSDLTATIAVAVFVLAALYWATYRVFNAIELIDKTSAPV